MLTKKHYSIKDMAQWTRWETFYFLLLSTIVTILYEVMGFSFLNLPWTPIALIGTAVAFIVGFQNNAAYGRIWEARKIWGGIVNVSRTWGMKVRAMVSNQHSEDKWEEEKLSNTIKILVHRHIAWMTALRYAMRQPKPWEVFEEHSTNKEWANMIHIPEREQALEAALEGYISQEEKEYILTKGNKAAALLYLQSAHLKELKESGHLWEFSFLELENILQELFSLQGKSERIKNFPYPRQYATLSHYFVRIFLLLLPFGIIPEFAKIGTQLEGAFPMASHVIIWLGIPFCSAVSWVFHTMQRIGTVGENPFEGSANDVPISTMARGIEIDLRQLLDEEPATIPTAFAAQHDVQM